MSARRALPLALLLASGCLWRHASRTAEPAPMTGVWRVVRAGETVSLLASRYGIPQDDVVEINGLGDADRLEAGREIFLPGATAARTGEGATAPAPLPVVVPAADPRLRWPVRGEISSRFGERWGKQHEGIDIAAPEGTPIVAAAAGRVVYSGEMRGYGNVVLVEHAGGWVTVYAHNDENLVDEGDEVSAGDEIARVGQTGRATGPHLHFELRRGVLPLDPTRYLED